MTQASFGGNFFNRDQLGEQGLYDELSAALGVENIRYPGGAITERLSSHMVKVFEGSINAVSNEQFPTDQIDLVVQTGTIFRHSKLDG